MVGLKSGLGWAWRTEKLLPPRGSNRGPYNVASRYKLLFMVLNTRTVIEYIIVNNVSGIGRGLF